MTTLEQVTERLSRLEIVAALKERDGDRCQHPDCGKRMDFSLKDDKRAVTIDHHIPQVYGKANGWTYDEIWDLDNLKLMHQACNAKKGDLLPNEDGTLPVRAPKTFKYKRDKRAQRADICTACNVGRDLGPDEVCAACGSGPMPERYPRWAKVRPAECDHALFWCWSCSIGITPRAGATEMIMFGGEGGE